MERNFKGIWIPKKIWLDEELTALDKMIYAEIDSLDGENGCYASNKYLADFCQCSESKVSISIKKLIEKGYVEVESFDGRNRVLRGRLLNFKRQTVKNSKADCEILKESNIIKNTNKDYIIYNDDEIEEERPSNVSSEEDQEIFRQWMKARHPEDAERWEEWGR